MRKLGIALTLLLAATFVAATERARFTPANASSITITGVSTVHEWSMSGSTIDGTIDIAPEIVAAPASAEAWTSDRAALVSVKILVANITSPHDRMNRIMLDAMKAKNHPEVRYDLLEARLLKGSPDAFVMTTRGKLTIAGVTRDVAMDVAAARNGEKRYILTGQAPLKMTDFGITPPTAMMGTIRSADQVKVSFRWVVDRSN
jgi:polyisoprenoid-binding protein YceI